MARNQVRRDATGTSAITVGIWSAALAVSVLLSGPARASFMPVMDEFWVVKNGNEIFRDPFDDGALPPSGPDDAITSSGDTYTVNGAGGMTSESGGKLTMTPSLGAPSLISGINVELFTGTIRILSTNPANPNFLGQSDSFEIHGLFDLVLPGQSGQAYGIRATDRSSTTDGKDVLALFVGKSPVTGDIVVASRELDFSANSADLVDSISIQSDLASAVQVELIISKQANSDLLAASFMLYDTSMTLVDSGTLDNHNNVTGDPVQIYTDVAFTRPQFYATDVPEPGTLIAFGLGLAALGVMRRRRPG